MNRTGQSAVLGAVCAALLTSVMGAPTAAAAEQRTPPEIEVGPAQLVFSAVEGEACPEEQLLSVVTFVLAEFAWTARSEAPWASLPEPAGMTPSQAPVVADCAGLPVGVHETRIVVTKDDDPEVTAAIPVVAIINPAVPVRAATWRDGHAGAFSASTDDGRSSGALDLTINGASGTFVMNGTQPPPDYAALHADGHEIGSHLVNHRCAKTDYQTLIDDIVPSIDGAALATGNADEVVSLVWPCGWRDAEFGVVADDYFLSARGYNINALEDAVPQDYMNLKSFNSHEHTPYPPADLKTIVDAAEAQGKWANLVLHDIPNDDGAITYATERDVWVAPIGDVVRYILQRERTVLSAYAAAPGEVSFAFHRIGMPPSPVRDFERSLSPEDVVTFETDLGAGQHAADVRIGDASVPFTQDGSTVTFSAPVGHDPQTARIAVGSAPAPAVAVDAAELRFVADDAGAAPQELTITEAAGGALQWTATSAEPWLSVSPGAGADGERATVSVDASGLDEGVHRAVVTVGSTSNANTVTVPVTLIVRGGAAEVLPLDYADAAALAADGWDFLGRTRDGAARDTETGVALRFTREGVRVPVDTGDLWRSANDTRNTLFRDLPEDWSRVQVRVRFEPYQHAQHAGIAIYGSDDDYAEISRAYNAYAGGNGVVTITERDGDAADAGRVPTGARSLLLRLERPASGEISGSFSTDDGATWTAVGGAMPNVDDARLALVTAASPSGFPYATFSDLRVAAGGQGPEPTPTPTPTPTPRRPPRRPRHRRRPPHRRRHPPRCRGRGRPTPSITPIGRHSSPTAGTSSRAPPRAPRGTPRSAGATAWSTATTASTSPRCPAISGRARTTRTTPSSAICPRTGAAPRCR
ncbi:BACON domain-containing protein [Microbacterium sp. Marseille-Q6965]|uniref:BACON domain-containing protein n=1 Tax=Microbacterium sp. Marseille-Q6965 TaxID=2965072 RepID=UPI0021B74CFB|nr:hypothetical protein [Microbacterium sp. Marseille-Q6965]